MVVHYGGCHCGKIKITINAPDILNVVRCNCSICKKKGFLHLFITKDNFTVKGEDNLSCYTFGTHTAKHYFCKYCGICSYYIPRSHPNDYSININCLESETIKEIIIKDFDGKDSYEKQLSEIQ